MMQDLYKLGMDFLMNAFKDSISNIELFFLAYVLALAVFLFRKDRDIKAMFVYPILFALFTVFNPYLMIPIADKIGLAPRIRRIYWLLPINLVLAFSATWIIHALSKRWKQAATAIVFLLLIALLGENQLTHMVPAENIYKIKDETIAIANMIEDDAQTDDVKTCLYADIQLLELRQYDPSITNTIRRKDMLNWPLDPTNPDSIQDVLKENKSRHIFTMVLYHGVQTEPSIVKKHLKKNHIQYVIPNKEKGLEDYFQNMGLQKIGETEHYTLMRME